MAARPPSAGSPRAFVIRPKLSLFLASFLMLFVELALIRGTTAAVVYLSFFTNLVLLASFLGIGLGFLRPAGREAPVAPGAAAPGRRCSRSC